MPTDEVAYLEMFTFNKRRKQIVRQTHKTERLDVYQEVVITIENTVLYTKELDPVAMASAGVREDMRPLFLPLKDIIA